MPISWQSLPDKDAVRALFDTSYNIGKNHLILKHSSRCMISSMIKGRLESQPDNRIDYYLIEVNSDRQLSNFLQDFTGIQHESPQSFLIVDGILVDDRSHSSISSSALTQVLDKNIKIGN